MQRTIDYIIAKHNHKLSEIESIGIPEKKEVKKDDKDSTGVNYFLFNVE